MKNVLKFYCLIMLIVELIRKNLTNLAARLSTKNHKFLAYCVLAINKRQNKTPIMILVHQRMFLNILRCCLAAGMACKSSFSKYFLVPIK